MIDLTGLKVGDPVIIVYSAWAFPDFEKSEIVSITDAGDFKLKGYEETIWTKSGNKRGTGVWDTTSFIPFDQKKWDENLAALQEIKDRFALTQVEFLSLPIERVREILTIVNAHTNAALLPLDQKEKK